jgi:hypothetical protein
MTIQVLLDLDGAITVMQSSCRGQAVRFTSLPTTSSTRTARGLRLPLHSGPVVELGTVLLTRGRPLTLSCRKKLTLFP